MCECRKKIDSFFLLSLDYASVWFYALLTFSSQGFADAPGLCVLAPSLEDAHWVAGGELLMVA